MQCVQDSWYKAIVAIYKWRRIESILFFLSRNLLFKLLLNMISFHYCQLFKIKTEHTWCISVFVMATKNSINIYLLNLYIFQTGVQFLRKLKRLLAGKVVPMKDNNHFLWQSSWNMHGHLQINKKYVQDEFCHLWKLGTLMWLRVNMNLEMFLNNNMI